MYIFDRCSEHITVRPNFTKVLLIISVTNHPNKYIFVIFTLTDIRHNCCPNNCHIWIDYTKKGHSTITYTIYEY